VEQIVNYMTNNSLLVIGRKISYSFPRIFVGATNALIYDI